MNYQFIDKTGITRYREHHITCCVFGCGVSYPTGNRFNYNIHCPNCGYSWNDVDNAGTNDPALLKQFFEKKG